MSHFQNRHQRRRAHDARQTAVRAGVSVICLAALLGGAWGCSSTSQSSPPSQPSSMPPSMPSPSGSSTPSGSSKPSQPPRSAPAQTSGGGQQGSQPPGSQPPGSQPSGTQPPGDAGAGGTSGHELPDLGGAAGSGIPESDAGTPGAEAGGAEPGWEEQQPAGGDDGWETSNQLPGTETADIPPMPSERGPGGGSEGTDGEGGGDAALEEALKDFDGEILAEREVIRARANETAGRSPGTLPELGSTGETEGAASGSGQVPGMPPGGTAGDARGGPVGIPSSRGAPPPPGPAVAGADLPDDIPDAKDDDIIARQLREAAMRETDPELKEKLWDEYRRYKGI